ncbi:MAG: hypothetical protein RL693_732 [Verrucomicrobiota bacterium]|jgi:hypothetical protein
MQEPALPLQRLIILGLLAFSGGFSAQAKQPVLPADKSGYHLFKPTPEEQMRDLITDRPDKTESPYTVDAGHFQIEADIVNWTRNHDAGISFDAIDAAAVNLKAGLTNYLDFQVIVNAYHCERTRSGELHDSTSGFGDLTLRTKLNFWGNDGGRTAFGIMPFVTLPTASGDYGVSQTEGGIILPLAIQLAEGWGLGMMTEWDFVSAEDGGSTHRFVNSISLSHDFTEQLGMYLEFFSDVPTENTGDWIGTVDVGFTYAVTKNVQFDAGVNFGVTEAADDLNPFIGFSVRL